MTPSIYQQDIYDFIEYDEGSAVIEAVAGSGKTTTIVNAVSLIPKDKSILMLAFNRSIKKELKERVPRHVVVETFNSLGASMLRKRLGNLTVNAYQLNNIVADMMPKYLFDEIGIETIDLAKKSKVMGLLPRAIQGKSIIDGTRENWEWLIDHFCISIDKEHISDAIQYAEWAIDEGITIASDDRIIDYDDQVYLPAIKGVSACDKYDFVFVDEAQDASPVRMKLVEMSLKDDGRMIAVGDRSQAIYGFSGADSKAMQSFIDKFDAIELPLSTSYRCAKNIVKEAQKVMPTIQHTDNAPQGIVESIDKLDQSTLQKGDMIICRKNAPIISTAYSLMSKGIPCHVLGRDFSSNLTSLIKKLKPNGLIGHMGLDEKLSAWESSEIERWQKEEKDDMVSKVIDNAMCIRAVMSQQDITTIDELLSSIKNMFGKDENLDAKNTITLCSVHKSKGLESDRVFILNRSDMPAKTKKQWQHEQEMNLIYVAITRAKKELYYVN